ncbi:fused MFS/spermidine synthase [Herbiconiux sp. CPCC 205763]|uniref:Fused MFS/spermidine synthase n=1 Tax=Herbiconiux aconitum TaxID=2970913 RepID=A0ABT2GP28_9MICO|nr:fused MFS/spermidine synthase [Herbiconiux aconitum]MCS5717982.1 fused MFS/spermidine synthase [Herbiconiux aconitum]
MTHASITLQPSGSLAEIAPDPVVPGSFVLSIGGTVQSHVSLGDPGSLFYDYVRRIGNAIDGIRMPGEPITAVHLGAGALTLPRYVQATRPESEQHVIELEVNLVDFVTAHLPLPAGTDLAVHPGDAFERLADLAPFLGGQADLVLADLYQGTNTPPHLRTTAFFERAADLLVPAGVLAVNVADDDGLPALREQLTALAPVLPHLLVLGPASVLRDARTGNAVVLASRSPALFDQADSLRLAGPHPGAVLSSEDDSLNRLVRALHDADPDARPGVGGGD